MRLEDLFASKAHAKVLQYLLDNPRKGFSLRYLARVAGVAPSTVGVVVNNLERTGVVYQRKLRSAKLIALNPSNPVTETLQQLVSTLSRLQDKDSA